MNLTLPSAIFYLAMFIAGAFAARISSSTCFVADRIQIHNTLTSLWWNPKLSRAVVTHRPLRAGGSSHEWLVFNVNRRSYQISTTSVNKLIEIAHRMPGTGQQCRFLLHSQGRIRMSRPSPCRPRQFGEQSLFSYGFEYLTNRQWIIVGSRPITEGSRPFLGLKGRSLRTASVRDRHMKFWDIKISHRKTCF